MYVATRIYASTGARTYAATRIYVATGNRMRVWFWFGRRFGCRNRAITCMRGCAHHGIITRLWGNAQWCAFGLGTALVGLSWRWSVRLAASAFRLASFPLVLLLPVVPVVVAAGAAAAALAPCMLLVACRVALGVYSRDALGIYSRVALGIYSRVTLGIYSRIYNRTGHVVHHEVQPRARLERVLQKHTREALQTPPRCHDAAAHWNGLAGGFRWIRYNRPESGGFSAKGQCDS
jgi:hypothetical protein